MKKVLSCVCVCLLVFVSRAYGADYAEVLDKATEISVALETSDNVEEFLGEAVILMIENDILTSLEQKGETARAMALKASADEALAAAANDSENAREKAIAFSKGLNSVILVLLSYETHIGFVEAIDSEDFTTDTETSAYARCTYTQTEDNRIAKFIVAKYDTDTKQLINANAINVGEGLKIADKKNYHIKLEKEKDTYYRIFLFDGTTLEPVLPSQRIG